MCSMTVKENKKLAEYYEMKNFFSRKMKLDHYDYLQDYNCFCVYFFCRTRSYIISLLCLSEAMLDSIIDKAGPRALLISKIDVGHH